MEVSEQSDELSQTVAEDTTVVAELRSQANELLDWLVQLDAKHCEEVATLREQLTRLRSDTAADGAVCASSAAVESEEMSGRGAGESDAEMAAVTSDPMILVLGIAVGVLFIFLLVLARSSFKHKTAKQTISRLLAWAESRKKVPELSKAALWSSRASIGGSGSARFPAASGSANTGGVLSLMSRGVLFLLQSTVGAILTGLLRGISQGLFWILTLPFLIFGGFWLFKLVTSWGAESSAMQADFVLTKEPSDALGAGGKLSKGISGVLNSMIRQILL